MEPVDFLIIRSMFDDLTTHTNHIGEGLKEYLEGKNFTVTDLCDADASPENVEKWLGGSDKAYVKKAVIVLDHGSKYSIEGERDNKLVDVIHMGNVVRYTKGLHVYTLACHTGEDGGLGEKAVGGGCESWLGYAGVTQVISGSVADEQSFKDCIWSYIIAMADGKTIEECEAALRSAYQARVSTGPGYHDNLSLLKLRTRQKGLTVGSADKKPEPVSWFAMIMEMLAAIFHL